MKENVLITIAEFEEAERYWLEQLSGELSEVKLLGDFPRTTHHKKANHKITFPNESTEKIRHITKNNNLSLFILLLTVFKILIARHTGQDDIIVVSPIYNISNQEYNQYVALRSVVDPRNTFKNLLMHVKQTVVQGYKNEHYSIGNIIDTLGIKDRLPLFGWVLLLENIHEKTSVDDIIKRYENDIIFSIRDHQKQLQGDIIYNLMLFEENTIQRLGEHFLLILTQVLNKTGIPIGDIRLMTEKEKKQLLFQFNNTGTYYPADKTIHELFEEQVEKTPDPIAVGFVPDISDIFEELNSEKIDPYLLNKIETCCFKENPYIYRCDVVLPGDEGHFKILKTHRHNSMIVNKNVCQLLNRFDGKRNIASIFSEIKGMSIKLLIYSLDTDDTLEITTRVVKKEVICLEGRFEDFVHIVKSMYRSYIVDLVDVNTVSSNSEYLPLLSPGYFDPGESWDDNDSNVLNHLLHPKKRLSKARVLLLGDTPGMATTGLLYLASYLKRNGIKVYCQFNDPNRDYASLKKNIPELIRKIQPEVVAVSMKWFLHIARVFEICKIVKEHSPQIKVVVGGNTASFYREKVILNEYIDYVICGDGEQPLLKICQGADDIPNCVYKKEGKVIENPISYIQDKTNSSEIYLSHLDEILLSNYASVFGTFFIYTHKGCGMNCLYCGGCSQAQEKTFNRATLFGRPVQDTRKDIIAAQKYASTFMFDFDAPNTILLDYCKKILKGIQLSSYFCIFTNLILPSPGLIKLVNNTFKYVYWNIDIASLSQRHRNQLYSLGLVKPQPSDQEILNFFKECEKYNNNEVRINLIAGLPYFTAKDIALSEKMLSHIMSTYPCFSELHWARLHAQPGAPIVENAENYNMHSYAKTFEDFLKYSNINFDHSSDYPGLENFRYPYVYSIDDDINSKVSKYYSETNLKIDQYKKNKRKQSVNKSLSLSYKDLNARANQLAAVLREKGVKANPIVGLMVKHPLEVVVGILGILKAGGAYLPIDADYPEKVKENILKDSNIGLLVLEASLTNALPDLPLSVIITPMKENNNHKKSTSNLELISKPTDLAYVIYTSGTTAQAKGILAEHKGIVNYTYWRLRTYQYTETDVTLQMLSYCFDGFGSNFYSGLLSGGTLIMVPDSNKLDFELITRLIEHHKVTNVSLVPVMYRMLLDQAGKGCLKSLRFVVLAGEETSANLIKESKEKAPHILLINEYGPTETTVALAAHANINESNTAIIGAPISNIKIYILDNSLTPVPIKVCGELCAAGIGVARGYLNNPELTFEKFILAHSSWLMTDRKAMKGAVNRIYKTGDLARWLPDGNIEFLGRKDYQVKIRGSRIEPGQIERQILNHGGIKEAVVTAYKRRIPGENENQPVLSAYIVPAKDLDIAQLRDYLSGELPGFMIPSYFVLLEEMPLTPNGKVDRKALPEPEIGKTKEDDVPPRDELEKKLAGIWSELLNVDADVIGIHSNFFELGGHSLKATALISRLYKILNVKIPLGEIFRDPTIKGLSGFIKEAAQDTYSSPEPVEKKEYYEMSSAQKRLYFLQQMDLKSTAYNATLILPLGKDIEKDQLEFTLKKLIARHESLRTWFEKVNDVPVQRVHHQVDFEIEYYDLQAAGESDRCRWEAVPFGQINACGQNLAAEHTGSIEKKPFDTKSQELKANIYIKNFIRPFDLSRPPLIRSGLIRRPDNHHIWIVDLHHIISDGTSQTILTEDFIALYSGKALPGLRTQYKDFSQWQNRLFERGVIKTQMDYWLDLYQGEIPRLQLPTDNKRPKVFTFSGDHYTFTLAREDSVKFKRLASRCGGTLYMNILTALNTLFYKYNSGKDIIIGCAAAGRHHPDLRYIVGMFVNTLAMRNYPQGEKTYEAFLKEVSNRSVKAFDNQDIQFEELVDQLDLERDASKNPLFDVLMVVQNFRRVGEKEWSGQVEVLPLPDKSLSSLEIDYKKNTTRFDMTFFVYEAGKDVYISIEYYTAIFKKETIIRLAEHLKKIIKDAVANPGIKLKDIHIMSEQEKEQVLYRFNNTKTVYPGERSIVELFEEQVLRTPDYTAVAAHCQGEEHSVVTYRELDTKSTLLALYLYHENGVVPDQPVGILMDRSLDMIAAIIGILRAGGAYVPISPSFPEERIKRMINEPDIRILIGQKRYIKTLNRLQWECRHTNPDTFLCIDSQDVHGEDETEENELMSRKLWEYVGEDSVDEITGGGWNDSYTGNPIPKPEMDEYGDNILKKLQPLLHKDMRVLELGTASGISMYRIAPKVGLYYGTDLSRVIIEKNQEKVNKQGHQNIKLRALAAHEISQLDERDFDLVIINSVIQCFNGHNYLRKVIRKTLELMKSKGYLFIGDIMDQDLKEDLTAKLVQFRQTNKSKNYKTKIDWSQELFISRRFLQDLVFDYPCIRDAAFSGKIYTIKNELTEFRYDALVYIDKTGKTPRKTKQRHKNQHDLRALEKYKYHTGQLPVPPGPGNLAYIIYTSGSTGIPKGVMAQHKGVVRLVKNTNFIRFKQGDRILQTGALEFDASTFEIWGVLLNGLTLVLEDKNNILVPGILKEIIKKDKITTMWMTSSFFNLMLDSDPEIFTPLRNLLVGGEALSPPHINRLRNRFPGLNVINGYGPTENVTFSTTYLINKEYKEKIPIGKPIANSTAYIVDVDWNLLPVGVSGELCVGGDGVAWGYLNDVKLTAEKFIANPFEKNNRWYRTGDYVKWMPDGNIEFLGRMDSQVKIRGFRIELEEIENQLLNHDSIKHAVVIDRIDATGSKYLGAYIVSDEFIEISELNDMLSKNLPGYMLPSFIMRIEKVPLTPNGKVDRQALPEPTDNLDGQYLAPRNETEEILVRIWVEVLGIGKERIGIGSNFFELGGHSLKATVMTAKIHKALGVKVPLAEIFTLQTIQELSQYIKNSSVMRYSSIEKAEEKEYYALSAAQKRLYIIQQLDLESTGYNMPYRIPLGKTFDKERLEDIFKKLIQRHESFRTSFHMINETPVQRVHAHVEFKVDYLNPKSRRDQIRNRASNKQIQNSNVQNSKQESVSTEKQPATALISSFIRPFDLSQAPLLRVGLIQTNETKNLLLVEMHHIISDGTSQGVLKKEFAALYAGEELPPLRLQYKDYSQWQNSDEQQEIKKTQEKYWLKEFSGEQPVLNLPTDFPRPLMQSFEGKRLRFFINKEITGNLKELSKKTDTTLYMILLSVYNILLSKLSGLEDIIVGTPIAGRRHADLQDIIGMFVNTLAMRNYPEGAKGFIEFLKEVKERTLEVYENQEYPFEELVEKVPVDRDTSRNPIFDVMFNFLNQADYQGKVEDVHVDAIDVIGESKANFDITCQGSEIDGMIYFMVDYCTKLYKEETLRRFIDYFKKILREIKKNPGKQLSSIEFISEEEKNWVLFEFNQTPAVYPKDKTLNQLFEEQVERASDRIALVGKRANIHLSYMELNEKSNQLAGLLIEKGVGPDTIAAIMVDRSLEMIIGILGILKAGGAYLPIDPDYPEERINYMLADSGAKILLSKASEVSSSSVSIFGGGGVCPNSQLAYIIYTSGSTGQPKGVMVNHHAVINLIFVLQEEYPLKESDTYLLKTSFVFDVSAAELFGWYLEGGRLAVLEKDGEKDPQRIMDAIAYAGVTHINFVPSMFNAFLEGLNPRNISKLSSLKYIFLAGEALLAGVVDKFRRLNTTIELENIYGPTEGAVYSSKYSLSGWNGRGSIPIGKPLPNIKLYIFAKENHLQPVGVPGELCIGGEGLARGYLNNPEMTNSKFQIPNKKLLRGVQGGGFLEKSPPGRRRQKIYRTGDLARWLWDGNIEFLGRMDHQVKIRGFRVELGEIETQLLNHSDIKETVVIAGTDSPGRAPINFEDRYLCAYVVSDREFAISELREYLSMYLPGYMIPSYLIFLEKIPLTPNGKIDRRALPAPQLKPVAEYAAPRDEIEKKLLEIWSTVLKVDKEMISIDANFFELGGHSLKATIMLAKMHKELSVKLPLKEVFKNPTIKGLAGYIKGAVVYRYCSIEPAEEKEYYTASSAQKRLFILRTLEGENSTNYNIAHVVLIKGKLDRTKMQESFKKLIQRNESLRTFFHLVEEKPVQIIQPHDHVEFKMEYSQCEEEKAGKQVNQFIKPFDLANSPIFKARLLKIGEDKHILMVGMHHIIADGASMQLLIKEFMALYDGKELPKLRLQYKDYSEWQSKQLRSGEIEKQGTYWMNRFKGEISVLNVPTDYPRPAVRSTAGSIIDFQLDRKLTLKIKQLAAETGTTLYMALLSAFNILLSKYTSQEDIVVGTPVSGRNHADLLNLIGTFANMLAMKNSPHRDKTFKEFLGKVKENALRAYENQDYQFEQLLNKLGIQTHSGRNPLFDVVFNMINIDMNTGDDDLDKDDKPGPGQGNNLIFEPYGYEYTSALYDLLLRAVETAETIKMSLEYSTALFKPSTIEKMTKHYVEILNQAVENRDIKIKKITVTHGLIPGSPESEKENVDFNF